MDGGRGEEREIDWGRKVEKDNKTGRGEDRKIN